MRLDNLRTDIAAMADSAALKLAIRAAGKYDMTLMASVSRWLQACMPQLTGAGSLSAINVTQKSVFEGSRGTTCNPKEPLRCHCDTEECIKTPDARCAIQKGLSTINETASPGPLLQARDTPSAGVPFAGSNTSRPRKRSTVGDLDNLVCSCASMQQARNPVKDPSHSAVS
eukprot:1161033-Pelagomonas_calceolata.AAC.4